MDTPQPSGQSPADSETPGSGRGGDPLRVLVSPTPAPWFLCLDRVPVHRKQIAPWVWGTRGAFDKGTQVWAELRSLRGWRPELGAGRVCPAQPPGSAGAGLGWGGGWVGRRKGRGASTGPGEARRPPGRCGGGGNPSVAAKPLPAGEA